MNDLAKLQVLIVDDEDDVRRGLCLLVRTLGAEVREAESGEAALELLRGWSPHLMLSDVSMGGISGMELIW